MNRSIVFVAALAAAVSLCPGVSQAQDAKAKKIVLVAGRPSHGYGSHEHNAGLALLKDRLEKSGLPVKVELVRSGWPADERVFDGAAAIVLYMDGGGGHPALRNLDKLNELMGKGTGLMCMHYAVEVPKGDAGDAWMKWIGGYYETHWSINPHWSAKVTLKKGHAITNGVEPFEVHDEWYYNMRFREGKAGVVDILEAVPDEAARSGSTASPRGPKPHIVEAKGRTETLMWAVQREDGGRGVGFTGGHFHWNWGHPGQMRLALNAIVWIAGLDVPESGVKFDPPTLAELEAGQDEANNLKPEQREEIRKKLELWQGRKMPADAPASPAAEAKPLFDSGVIDRQTPGHARDLDIAVKGVKTLYLVVNDAGDSYAADWADWAEPRLIAADGAETKLTDLKWKSAEAGWGQVRHNANAGGRPMRIAGDAVAYGIGTHANSVIAYDLGDGGRYARLKARVGIDHGGSDQSQHNPTVRFLVYADKLPGTPPAPLSTGGAAAMDHVPLDGFVVADGFEVTLWAMSPLLQNPTNMDFDAKGRAWVAEGLNYRGSMKRKDAGDRIVVVSDTDGDGKADASHTFVQDPELVSPLGIAVIGDKVIVSQPPHLIVYTDVDGDAKFDPAVDKRENLLTGFEGRNHDHSLHSVTVHPSGRWMFNCGNMGANVTDKGGRTFYLGSPYQNQKNAGKPSADGHVYIGGGTFTMRPDGTDLRVIGHNYRNSYEQTADSFGDVFMNDNDDPPACRTSWVMRHANFGFASADGKRTWGADRRPGQDVPTAQWRQDDPGTCPPGDVYGGGAPTGIVFYENGALGDEHRGLLLSCESARNVVFGYHPKPSGAGFTLERFDFLTTNPERKFTGADFTGGRASGAQLFRPSDVAVGPDGAVYVADWFDPRVGGHQTLDNAATGAIYRVAPKGFKPAVPTLDADTIDGQIAALCSPAVNVRAIGFYALRQRGAEAVPAVTKLLGHENPYIVARAVWLLAQLGDSGMAEVIKLLAHADPRMRTLAFRALEETGADVLAHAAKLAGDADTGVRREAALAMRDVPWDKSRDVLLAVAERFDGADRYYLEALGTGATGKEAMLYKALREKQDADALRWSPAFARIAWRLHPVIAVPDLAKRATSGLLTLEERKLAIDSLAFIPDQPAAEAVLAIATRGPADSFDHAAWWVRNRHNNDWRAYDLAGKLPAQPPAKPVVVIDPNVPATQLPPLEQIVALRGDAKRGEATFATRGTCLVCHSVAGKGGAIGPDLTQIGRNFSAAVLIESLVDPSSAIALGYETVAITKRDGSSIVGFIVGEGDPVLIKDIAGNQTAIDAADIAKRDKLAVSIMPPASALGLTAQDLADLAAYLRSIE